MTDAYTDYINDDITVYAITDKCQWQILQKILHDAFHPVKAQVSGETHFLDTMVDFVKFPQKINAVQESVNTPLNKVAQYK